MKWSSKSQHSVWASTLFMGTVVPHSLLVVHNNDDFDQRFHFWIHHSIRPVDTNFQSSSSLIWHTSAFLLVYPSPNYLLTPSLPLQPFLWSCARSLPSFLFLKDMTFRYRLSAVLSNFLRIHYSQFSANNSLETIFLVWKYLFVCQTVLSHHPSVHPLCSSYPAEFWFCSSERIVFNPQILLNWVLCRRSVKVPFLLLCGSNNVTEKRQSLFFLLIHLLKDYFLYIVLNTISQNSETNTIFDSCPFKRPPRQYHSVITLKLNATHLHLETI